MTKRYETDADGQILIRIHDLNTFMAYANETHLCGKDHHGNPIHVLFDTYELLGWLDVQHMKDELTEYIDEL